MMWTSWLSAFRFESPPTFDAKLSVDFSIGAVSDQKEKASRRLSRERKVACYGNSMISQLRPILQRSQFVLRQYLAETFDSEPPIFKI